jgi:thiamine-phosphate pyrophosphorylase
MMDKKLMRILDANFNRTRESLRVMEDYARFVLDAARLSGQLKAARHQLREAVEMLGGQRLLAGRNTPGDVGTKLCSAGEMERSDAAAVVTAACKRVVESLRALEEFSKTVEPEAAKRFERLRYRCYEWEVQLVSRGEAKRKLGQMRLYVLISSELCRKGPLEVAKDVLVGGADCVQLREKQMASGQYLALAKEIGQLCRQQGKLFIVNDRPDIAVAAGADGVHLGQDDLPIAGARKVLPSQMIIGLSTHSIAQAKKAVDDGADYISVGPVFATATKPSAEPVGIEYVQQVAQIDLPQVAIGGISLDNIAEVIAAGAKCVGVCSAIICSDNPEGVSRDFARQLRQGD